MREPSGRSNTVTVSVPRRSMHVLCLPSEPISLIVAYDRLPTLLDDHAARLLNQETVALAHLAAGPAHIIKTGRIILRRRWHEGALQLRRLRSGRRRRQLNRRSPGTALTLLLLRNRQRLCTL